MFDESKNTGKKQTWDIYENKKHPLLQSLGKKTMRSRGRNYFIGTASRLTFLTRYMP
ncbi:MAG: hypothetical protein ABI045_05765 [Flavobacteriales bacterium]